MAYLRAIKTAKAASVGRNVRVLMLNNGSDPAAPERLLALGGQVDFETEMFTALAALMDDPMGYELFVMDADDFGGMEAGLRAFQMLRAANVRIPVILISQDCRAQVFPEERCAPIVLKAPLSMVSLRIGVEHALDEHLFWRAA